MPDTTQTVQPEGQTTSERRSESRGSTGGGSSRMNVQLKSADYEAGANYLSPNGGAAAALRPLSAPGDAPVQMAPIGGAAATSTSATSAGAAQTSTSATSAGAAQTSTSATSAGAAATSTSASAAATTTMAGAATATEGAAATTTTRPVATVTKTTDYGKFVIYPNDFVGPLPVNDRAADTWTLRQRDYDELMAKLNAVKGGTSKIKLSGNAAFKSGTLLDLGWLMTVGVGQKLISALAAASFSTTIEKTDGGNACGYNPDADSWETTDTPPKKGKGANATVYYNPATLQIGDGAGWKTRPPAIGLAHELVHAWTAVNGQRARGETGGTNNRELQAVGLGAYKDAVISENQFRAAFGLPTRPVY